MPGGIHTLPSFYAAKGKPRVGIGGSMATLDLNDVRPKDHLVDEHLNGDSFLAEVSLRMPAELWAPPLAPVGDEEAFLAPEPSRRALIAGIAIVAALGAAALTYCFLALPAAKPPAETAQTPPVASSPTEVTEVQPAPTVAE